MLNFIKTAYKNFLQLVYPNNCLICQSNLLKNELCICTICETKLPYTNYHLLKNNPVEKKLWGRVKLENVAALLLFEKGLDVQVLISNLKYKKRQDVGEKLGEIYGRALKQSSSEFLKIDVIVPIPLHPKKTKSRGYNQCHTFALKIAEGINKPVDFRNIKRNINTISQTGKNRIKRWENVSQIFEVTNQSFFKGKHILIVDDMITTGATIEALATKLLEIENTKVSVLTMASAI